MNIIFFIYQKNLIENNENIFNFYLKYFFKLVPLPKSLVKSIQYTSYQNIDYKLQ